MRHVRVAILGTGFSGLGMACQLARHGERDFTVIERANEVGGTWRDNTYPGAACDIRSDLYSFSFAPNPDWKYRYGRQPEILDYLRSTATKFDIYPHISFGTELLGADWTGEHWVIETSRETFTATYLASGHGPLIEPTWPRIDGFDSFAGETFHSARWNHGVDLAGKTVAVIGTGASAIQFVPEIQKVAGHVTVFQRTPAWIIPRGDRPRTERRRRMFRRIPLLQRASRTWIFGVAETRFAGFRNDRVGGLMKNLATSFLEHQVKDPELRAKLTPDYRIGCKRILVSSSFYRALTKANVTLETSRIASIEGNEIVTTDGARHAADVLIAGTGFDATHPPVAKLVRGRDGRSLAEYWGEHMSALRGTTVPGFPNLFLLVGPNTALGHNSIVYIIEAQVDYVLKALARGRVIEAKPEAARRYNERVQRDLVGSVWTSGGCASYYLDTTGRNTTLWPHRAAAFRGTVRRFDPSEYLIDA
jgi:cation diffusion facilitator CzcD-associated flavoprotein CzcO